MTPPMTPPMPSPIQKRAEVGELPSSGRRSGRRLRWRLTPRLTDWSLALGVGLAVVTGLVGLDSGRPVLAFVFAVHGIAGLWLLLLLWGKLRRVWSRIVHVRSWTVYAAPGLFSVGLVALAIGSGVWWVAGGDVALAGFNLMNWHILFGAALAPLVLLHMWARAKRLRSRDLRGRRQAIQFGALALAAVALWPAQQVTQHIVALPGARRRFSGSREVASFDGNAFPASSWVADQPRPLDLDTWMLTIGGAVARPQSLSYTDLLAITKERDALEATLDCTGGFYSTQRWHGARIGALLERAEPQAQAQWVRIVSVTSYRWSLPLDEAKGALLATHIGDEPLSHEHGAPLRLVAPGRRGFQWVKWVVRIEALTAPDYGEILAIHTSSFTPEGRGER